jgi:hypothetical protein
VGASILVVGHAGTFSSKAWWIHRHSMSVKFKAGDNPAW